MNENEKRRVMQLLVLILVFIIALGIMGLFLFI
jgi:hypothetical protein